MAAFQFVLVIALVALTARSQQNSPQEPSAQPQPVLPASCPITRRPAKEFIAPIPYVRDENSFWLGTEPGSDPGHLSKNLRLLSQVRRRRVAAWTRLCPAGIQGI